MENFSNQLSDREEAFKKILEALRDIPEELIKDLVDKLQLTHKIVDPALRELVEIVSAEDFKTFHEKTADIIEKNILDDFSSLITLITVKLCAENKEFTYYKNIKSIITSMLISKAIDNNFITSQVGLILQHFFIFKESVIDSVENKMLKEDEIDFDKLINELL